MKIINLHTSVTAGQVAALLKAKLNPMFHKQRQSDVSFMIEENNGAVEISQPKLYEGILFHIEPKGRDLNITRSENCVDDVNSLTLESIIEILFDDLSGPEEVSIVQEG